FDRERPRLRPGAFFIIAICDELPQSTTTTGSGPGTGKSPSAAGNADGQRALLVWIHRQLGRVADICRAAGVPPQPSKSGWSGDPGISPQPSKNGWSGDPGIEAGALHRWSLYAAGRG